MASSPAESQGDPVGLKCEQLLRVAVDTPFNGGVLTYAPPEQGPAPRRGELCYAPLGKREIRACVLGLESRPSLEDLSLVRPLAKSISPQLKLPASHLDFLEWVAAYYQYPLGQLVFEVLPRLLKRPRPLSLLQGKSERRFVLQPQQTRAWARIAEGFGRFSQYLLHGITGSGKSVVYFKAIQKAIADGRSALLLLPEINLTPQFLQSLRACVDAPIFSYHSGLGASDRFGLWEMLCREGRTRPMVVVGVRSAVFLPIPRLGVIVVDEEHDTSFKQADRCPYNARDLALKRGALENIPVILGSATPSLETFHRFQAPRLRPFYLSMPERYGEGKLPRLNLVNTCQQSLSVPEGEAATWPFEAATLNRMGEHLARGEQVLAFVNRLGLALYMQCRGCGHQFTCPHCSVSLRVFKKRRRLSCHTCHHWEELPEMCPQCGNLKLEHRGFGTERLEQVLKAHFPAARVGRFDRDEVVTFARAKERLGEFERGEIDILVGTQMLAKGHNFPRVNLVVVLGLDGQLNFPDFRSYERAYQLLTQISGRAGRFAAGGEVMVQTACPDHRLFRWVQSEHFADYYGEEIKMRELCACPPYSYLAMIYLTAKRRERAVSSAEQIARCGHSLLSRFPAVHILGPRASIIEKRADQFTWVVMLRAAERSPLHSLLRELHVPLARLRGVSAKVDIDPYHIA